VYGLLILIHSSMKQVEHMYHVPLKPNSEAAGTFVAKPNTAAGNLTMSYKHELYTGRIHKLYTGGVVRNMSQRLWQL